MSGPSSAWVGMSGPPAIDIGMYSCGNGGGAVSATGRRVGDDADDLEPRRRGQFRIRWRGRTDALANWILTGEVHRGKRLVDDDDRLARDRCRPPDGATAYQPHAQHVDISVGDGAEPRELPAQLTFGSSQLALDHSPLPKQRAAERQARSRQTRRSRQATRSVDRESRDARWPPARASRSRARAGRR